MQKEINSSFESLRNVNYSYNIEYGLSYLTQERFNRVAHALSFLRRHKEIDNCEYHLLMGIFSQQHNNLNKIKYLKSQEPRVNAQKFIGRKKIRNFIFNRDGYKCLKCGCDNKSYLTLDHIVPISKGGENKLSNLQTLCKSCNCSKSTKTEDYR